MREADGQFIDLAGWKRRPHFDLFRHAAQPFFSVTVEVDVTAPWQRRLDQPEVSFFLAALFALLRAANASEPLRLRLRGEQVWRHERVGVGTTVLRPDETFGFARLDPAPTYDEFRVVGEAAVARATASAAIDPMHERDDLVYHSTLPWLRFTAITNALPGTDSIPRIVFGRVFADGRTFRMPLAVEVHHALVDGLDVARFVEAFEAELSG